VSPRQESQKKTTSRAYFRHKSINIQGENDGTAARLDKERERERGRKRKHGREMRAMSIMTVSREEGREGERKESDEYHDSIFVSLQTVFVRDAGRLSG
jgi:hypothetical protein